MPRSSYLSPGSSSLFEATSTNSAQTSTARTSTSMGDSTIVVGIDFGTTHSGVCWALNEGQKKLRVIMDWPNPQAANANAEKVPSTISYQDGIVHSWGYEVDIRAESFKWIKILLEPEKKYSQTVAEVRNSNNLLTKLGKTADEVVTDYLRQLWEYTREDIRKRIDEEHWEDMFKVHAVLTVPAMWSHKAKDRTLAAARRAGFPEYIEIVTEPEAAALATLKGKEQENTLKPGDAFVVCDAGGGTVDLISYRVKSINPLVLEECAIGDGGLCGSVFLDLAFEKWVIQVVGKEQYSRIKVASRNKMLREFEYGIKRSFNGDTGKDYSVDLRGVEDNPKEDILDDNIPVKPTVLRTIFDHIYCKIDQLVQQQVREVQEKNLNVKSILLVGGFGENRYIHQQLEATYKSQNIRVLQVDGAWSSICRGACMWGLEQDVYIRRGQNGERGDSTIGRPNGTITARISRYSYGIPIMEPFDPVRHVWRDRFQDPATGNIMANNQMRWLLRRGEMHEIGATMDIGVKEAVNGIGWRSKGNRPFHQRLYYSDQAVASSRKDDSVRQLCSVIFTVPEKDIRQAAKSYKSPVGSGKWRDTYFDMIVRLRSGVLDFIVCQKGVVVGQTEVSYSDIE